MDFLTNAGEVGMTWLTGLFSVILRMARMPEEWRWSTTIMLYKNMGISKIATTIGVSSYQACYECLREGARDEDEDEEGYGRLQEPTRFMPKQSATEAVHLVRRLLMQYKNRKRELHMVFIDIRKGI